MKKFSSCSTHPHPLTGTEVFSSSLGAAAADIDDPEISLRVACLDGSSLDLKVPPRELVREVKRTIGQVRQRLVGPFAFAES